MYLVVGASGFLGRYCIKNILEKTDETIIATYTGTVAPTANDARILWVQLDVCQQDCVKKIAENVDASTKIIYLAAFHHPDKVEEMPEKAWDVNVTSLANCVNLFHKAACFYYASTDTVYGEGSKDKKFVETDMYLPVNTYGRQKVLAEQITLAKGFNVVRFPFIFGTSLVEGRLHFFDHIKNDLMSGKTVEMFTDSYRSTLSFNQCAFYLIDLIEQYGACDEQIINISSDAALSKYEVAVMMAEKFSLDKNLVKGISIADINSIFKAKRATNSVLDNQKIKKLLKLESICLEIE